MNIKKNLHIVKNSFVNPNCLLVAVSKTKPVSALEEAYNQGIRDFGENKVQEMVDKHAHLPKDINWHMIGHLQRNKVKYIVPFVHLIHGVDSLKLLLEINKEGEKINRVVNCLLQIHIATEETKFGLSIEEAKELIFSDEMSKLSHIKIQGLMGMASFTENENQIQKEFQVIKGLFEEFQHQTLPSNVSMNELSIGMSGDYLIAQKEGSTMVRIGSAIFGARNYTDEQ
jgi:pyridoxal phosphate enzyme (YggS family)